MKSVDPLGTDSEDAFPPQSRQALRHVTMTPPSERSSLTGGGALGNPYLGATIDGRYEIECQLGEGGMGVVYRCIHTIIGKRVAMKILRADLARNDEVVERFLNEARSASSIGNPHIIDISDFGRLPDGATYFVMEYLEGVSLSDFLEPQHLLSTERVGGIMIQLTEALAAAHDAGIVHRDLKPENIFLIQRGSQSDFVKVLDFGIAKANSTGSKLTQAGQVFGTPHYMSPEQAAGAPVDQRADVYAVGVMLYELLTGTLPFDAENFMGILTQHMYKEPPPPSSREGARGRIVPALERIVLKCLEKAPTDRYQSMQQLGEDLRALFGDVPRNSLDEIRYSQVGAPARLDPLPLPASGHRRVFFVALGLAGLLGGVVAWSFGASPERQTALDPHRSAAAAQEPERTPAAITTVALAVTPANAVVRRDDEILGTSPISVPVGTEPVTLAISAPGYETRTVTLDGRQTGVTVQLSGLQVSRPPLRTPSQAAQRESEVARDKTNTEAGRQPKETTTAPQHAPQSGLDQLTPSRRPKTAPPNRAAQSSPDLLVDPWGGD